MTSPYPNLSTTPTREIIWGIPSRELVLLNDAVHVWKALLVQPDPIVQYLERTLSSDELAKANSFHSWYYSSRYIVSRGFLRIILSQYLHIDPRDVLFRYHPRGKPYIIDADNNSISLEFNLSHSSDVCLYAITSSRRVGIDIERVRPIDEFEQISRKFFTKGESSTLTSVADDHRLAAFFECWTRKEAYVKAIGDGLMIPLNGFEVSVAPGEPARLMSVNESPTEVSQWSMKSIVPCPGYISALVVEGKNVHYYLFSATLDSGLGRDCWQPQNGPDLLLNGT